MLRNLIPKSLKARIRGLLAESLVSARSTMDYLHPPVANPHYNFGKDRSLYPTFAARFSKILEELSSHPQYVWGALQGASLANALGLKRISMIEFGVGGGYGLLALEKITIKLEKIYGITIDVYGFDAAVGLPKPQDYRDQPNMWTEGFFPMDQEKLRSRLQKAQLFIGDVAQTVPDFLKSAPAPVGFISFDLDLYSSTMAAFRVFDGNPSMLLPRIHCYFDDIMGFSAGEHNGERLAISDFNDAHELRKISHTYGLKYFIPEPYAREMWVEMIFMAHLFDHPLYGHNDGMVIGSTAEIDRRGSSWSRIVR
jgi:hypothetical protein